MSLETVTVDINFENITKNIEILSDYFMEEDEFTNGILILILTKTIVESNLKEKIKSLVQCIIQGGIDINNFNDFMEKIKDNNSMDSSLVLISLLSFDDDIFMKESIDEYNKIRNLEQMDMSFSKEEEDCVVCLEKRKYMIINNGNTCKCCSCKCCNECVRKMTYDSIYKCPLCREIVKIKKIYI